MRTLKLLIIFLLLSFPFCASADSNSANTQIAEKLAALQKNPNDMETLRSLCVMYMNKADFNNALKYGERLQRIAYERKSYYKYVIYSHVIMGEAYTMKGDKGLAFNNLGQAKANLGGARNDTVACSVYNALGIYYINMQNDTYRALTNFFKGLKAAKRAEDSKMYNVLLSNIAETYYLRGDTTALKYALECHERGIAEGNEVLVYHSGISAAYLYYLKGDVKRASAYLDECSALMKKHDFHDRAQVYNIRGMIAMKANNPTKAAEWYRRSIAEQADGSVPNTVCAYLGYGRAASALGLQQQALDSLQRGTAMARRGNSGRYLPELLLAMSECYEKEGDRQKALDCYKQYHEYTDTLFNAEKELAVGDMREKYDTERRENLLKQQQIDLMTNRNRTLILLALLSIAIVAATLLYILYRRKNILYKAIVRQNQTAIKREQALREQLDGRKRQGKYASSPLTPDRTQTIFARLETLMETEKPYHDHMITKAKVAEMLDTNSTYLSQAINEQTGQTFTAYIGALRIKEAIRLISDPQDTTPIKAVCSEVGFSSMTTFYSLFQQTTGMTPATYRQKVIEMA